MASKMIRRTDLASRLAFLLALMAFHLPHAHAQSPESEDSLLMVGKKPPAIKVAGWIRGEPITSYEPGGTYVVEFWATWCGACIGSIPHVSELAETYRDDGLKVVGVSVWERDWSGVAPFVERMGDDMTYSVAYDGEQGVMANDWLLAADRTGIPSAFIVHDQLVAWIGHPMEMGEPLKQIIAGTYDHAGAREKAMRDRRLRAQHEVTIRSIHDKISVGEFEAAIVKLDELIAVDGKVFADFAETKLNLLTHQVGDLDRTYAYVRELQTDVFKNNRWMLHALAQLILSTEPFAEDRDVVLALRLAERANEIGGGEDPSVLETIALAESMLRNAERHGTTQFRPTKPGEAHGGSDRATPDAAAPAPPAVDPKSVWDAGVRLAEEIDEHGYRAVVLETQIAQDGTETPLFIYLAEVSSEDHGVFRGYRTYKRRSEPEGPPRIDPEAFEREAEAWVGRLDEFPQTTTQRLTESGWLLESVDGQRIQTRGSEVSTSEPSFTVAALAFRPSLRAPTRWIASPRIDSIESDESDGAAFRIRGRLPSENGTSLPNIKQRVAELHFDADPPLLRCFRIVGDPTGEYEVWELERRIVETQAFSGLGVPVPKVLETFERFGEEAHIWTERRRIRVVFLP